MVAFATQVKRRRGTQEQNDAFTGAEGEIVVDLTNMTLRVHDGRTQGGFVVGGGAGRNIGDIFFTARTDTSLNGAVEANGGQYNTTDFVGAESIGNILSEGKVPYMTIADFDTAVANNGFCTSFGWDGGTVFKVPKIPGMIITKDQLPVVGNGYALGLSNGYDTKYLQSQLTGSTAAYNAQILSTGTNQNVGGATGGGAFANVSLGITTDPTKSGIIATVDTVELRPMVQLANGATDEAVVVAGNVLADIAGIKDGDGFTQPGKNAIIGWGIPDYSAGIDVTASIAAGYTAPTDGFIAVSYAQGTGAVTCTINGNTITVWGSSGNVYSSFYYLFLSKNDVFKLGSTSYTKSANFYPLKGVN